MLLGCPLFGLHVSFYCGGLSYVQSGGHGWPPYSWLPPVGGIMSWLAAEAQGYLGLGLAHWWVEIIPGASTPGPC